MLTQIWSTKGFQKSLVCIFVFLLSSCDFISNKILTKPVVQVDIYQLSAQDFSKQLALRLKDLDALAAKDPKIVSLFKQQIINDFIVSTFVDLWFKETALSLSRAEVDKEIRSVVSSYPSDAAFREILSEADLSYTQWVAKIEVGLKKKKIVAEITKGAAKPSGEELQSFYNSNKVKFEQPESVLLSHIQVSDESQAEIVKKLIRQSNFTEVAKKYSTAYTAEAKDTYGWIEKGYAPDLEKAFKTGAGSTFGPITMPDGIHIFKIIEKKSFKVKNYSEVAPLVLSEVLALRETAKFTAWLDVQIKRYKIKKNLNMIDSIKVETQ
ncbi:MAG: peptidyl-prolyl cis-trans isomerase [Pseudobdellovibrio sp.]